MGARGPEMATLGGQRNLAEPNQSKTEDVKGVSVAPRPRLRGETLAHEKSRTWDRREIAWKLAALRRFKRRR
jgi:hypothetical protein